jgi:hypothetical protein
MGGLSNGISRFYSVAAEKQEFGGYVRASRRLIFFATLVVFGAGATLLTGLSLLGGDRWISLAAAALLFAVLSIYNSTLSGIQNAARQRAVVAFHGALDAWLKILLAVAAVLLLGGSGTAVVLAYAGSSLLVNTSQFIFLRRLIPPSRTGGGDDRAWMLRIWAYSWPFSIWGIFTGLSRARTAGFGGLRKHSGSWPIRSPVPARLHADRVGDWNGRVFYRTDPVPEIGRCDVGFAQRFRSRARMAHHVFLSGDDVTRLFAGNDVA